jgi:hypothetical protein
VSKPLVPQVCREGGEAVGGCNGRRLQWIEIALAITAENHLLGAPILNRETTIVKFNCDRIVTRKSVN